jgi:NDP-sugar pyrophosphorylase family protein
VVIREPVRIEAGVTLVDSTIGPNVTIETGSMIAASTLQHAILGRNVRVERSTVVRSVIGDDQLVQDRVVRDSVMDAGEVAAAR